MILKSNFEAFFQDTFFPMRYNAKSFEIKVVISGNVLLFKDIKISLGLLIAARLPPSMSNTPESTRVV